MRRPISFEVPHEDEGHLNREHDDERPHDALEILRDGIRAGDRTSRSVAWTLGRCLKRMSRIYEGVELDRLYGHCCRLVDALAEPEEDGS